MSPIYFGINYTNSGERTISEITSDKDLLPYIKKSCDEVYVMGFDYNNNDLIQHIVLNGCRIQ